jgi:anti-sigma regulatory factor (Ser/Thr protein kinase)
MIKEKKGNEMKQTNYVIDIVNNDQFHELISDLSAVRKEIENGSRSGITLNFEKYSSARPPVLSTVSSFIKFISDTYSYIKIDLIPPSNIDVKNYMARIKFFEINGFNELTYPFREYDPTGRFIELKHFDESNQHRVNQELTHILKKISSPDDFKIALAYCFTELLDNTCCHAEIESGGIICCQTYTNEIQVSIVDSGIGIAESMRKSPQYKYLDNCQLLRESVRENVSSKLYDEDRDHQGFGLFALNEIVRLSGGNLSIFSNGAYLLTNSKATYVNNGPDWKGTIINFSLRREYNPYYWRGVLNNLFTTRNYVIPEHFLDDDIF